MIKLRCPFCMWVRNAKKDEPILFPELEEERYFLINYIDVFGGGGKGAKKDQKIGFFINHDRSITIEQAKKNPQWNELIEQLRDKAKYILEMTK